MRKNYFKTIFIVIGFFTVVFSFLFTFYVLLKKYTIELKLDESSDDFIAEEEAFVEPIIVQSEADTNP